MTQLAVSNIRYLEMNLYTGKRNLRVPVKSDFVKPTSNLEIALIVCFLENF